MGIVRPHKSDSARRARLLVPASSPSGIDDDEESPFVPAYDLFEEQERALTPVQAGLVAVALLSFLPADDAALTPWRVAARSDVIDHRNPGRRRS